MSRLHFDKYEGLGNDFIVIDAADDHAIDAERARRLCDRRFGVGADGVLMVLPATEAGRAARMRVVNADGSVPEMCGNGLRCVALHVARARGVERLDDVFETDAGPRHVSLALALAGDGGAQSSATVTVDMGEARVLGTHTVDVAGERVELVAVDVGNPHAILLPVSGVHDRARLERLGPLLERHRFFPSGTNVELVSRDEHGLRLTVWERGVGFTLACGTGACATVAALVSLGAWPEGEEARVVLPGGELFIRVSRGRVTMSGPARHVFSGELA